MPSTTSKPLHFAMPFALAMALACTGTSSASPRSSEWSFTVLLDGKPIGSHRFVLESSDDQGSQTLTSEARFDVRFLGVPLYHYRHRVDERWSNGCLMSIEAQTDDNGRRTEVRGEAQSRRFEIQVRADGRSSAPAQSQDACVMSFAYWNPALANQTRLLDPGTGRIEPVSIASTTAAPSDLERLASTPLRGLRIGGLAQPIDVWYAGDRWVGLDTVVNGSRRLSYRLNYGLR